MNDLITEIETRLATALERLAAGDDLPPSLRLRLEGLCEAAVIVGAVDAQEIDALVEAQMKSLRGVDLRDALGADWRAMHPFPELPVYMDRAPVSPSAKR